MTEIDKNKFLFLSSAYNLSFTWSEQEILKHINRKSFSIRNSRNNLKVSFAHTAYCA